MSDDTFDLFAAFSSNKTTEADGAWLDLTPKTGVKIRAFRAKPVSDLRDKLTQKYTQMLRVGMKIPDEQAEEIGLQVLAQAVIVDWKGIKNAEGVEVPYSAEEAYAILKALPDFASVVIAFSSDTQNFRDEVREDGAKN